MDSARPTDLEPPQERPDSSRNRSHTPRSPTLSSSSALSPPSSPTPSSPRSHPHAYTTFPASSFPDRGPPPPRPERRRPPRASATIVAVPPSSSSSDPDNSRNHLNTHFDRRNTSSSSSQPRNENPADSERPRKSSQVSTASYQAVFGRRGSAQGSSPSEPYPSFQSIFVLSSSHVQESGLEQMAENSPPTSKPILLTSVEPSNPPAGSSSEMLPLSEFLSQSRDDGKSGRRSPDSPTYRSDASGPTFRLYNPPSSPPPPILFSNQSGKVPITTASGEFSGYQQYTPPREYKYGGGHSRISSHDHDGPVIGSGYSHETPATIAGSGVVTNADEDDYLNQGKPVRNYKVFRGRNVFLCKGRIITSRDFPAFVMAVLLLLIPTGLFHGFTSPYLWHRLGPAAPIIQAYLFIVTLSSMLKTSWTDPGIIPREIDSDPPVDAPLDLDINSASYYPPRNPPRIKEIRVGTHNVRLKYCDTCKIYRPPRCSHCRQCDNCVEDEDHHCIWLNNCIGRRNYRYFLIFVTTAALYALLTSALSLTHLLLLYDDRKKDTRKPEPTSFQNDVLAKAPVSALVMVYALLMGLAVGALATYHFWLATKNRTTHEQLTAALMRPHADDNPFDRGSIFGNCMAVLCRPPTRSYIRRRDYTNA